MRWYNFTFLQRNFRKIKTALFQSSTKTKSKTETLFRFEVSWYCYAFIFSLSGTKNIHFFSVGNQTEIGKRRKEGRKKEGYQINGLVFDFLEADGLIAAHRRSSSNCEFLTIPLQEWTIYIYVKFEDILKKYIKMTKRNFSESHNRRWHLD